MSTFDFENDFTEEVARPSINIKCLICNRINEIKINESNVTCECGSIVINPNCTDDDIADRCKHCNNTGYVLFIVTAYNHLFPSVTACDCNKGMQISKKIPNYTENRDDIHYLETRKKVIETLKKINGEK